VIASSMLVRDCIFNRTVCVDLVVAPFMPEMDIFIGLDSMPRVDRKLFDIKFACDPQSSNTRHGTSELLLL